MPPPFVWLDGCTPLHIHTSVDKYNLAYFISNRRHDSGTYMTHLDISPSEFAWNEDASRLALARLLTLCVDATLELLKEVCIFISGEPGQRLRLFLFSSCLRVNKSDCSKTWLVLNTQCQPGVSQFDVIFIAEHFPLSLLCSAQRSHSSLLCYSCGPGRGRVRTSAYSSTRRGAGAHPARRVKPHVNKTSGVDSEWRPFVEPGLVWSRSKRPHSEQLTG